MLELWIAAGVGFAMGLAAGVMFGANQMARLSATIEAQRQALVDAEEKARMQQNGEVKKSHRTMWGAD